MSRKTYTEKGNILKERNTDKPVYSGFNNAQIKIIDEHIKFHIDMIAYLDERMKYGPSDVPPPKEPTSDISFMHKKYPHIPFPVKPAGDLSFLYKPKTI